MLSDKLQFSSKSCSFFNFPDFSFRACFVFFFPIDYEKSYDNILSRLLVRPWDNWRGINPSGVGADFNPDPPIFAAKFANIDNYNHILAIANEDGRVSSPGS